MKVSLQPFLPDVHHLALSLPRGAGPAPFRPSARPAARRLPAAARPGARVRAARALGRAEVRGARADEPPGDARLRCVFEQLSRNFNIFGENLGLFVQ